MIEPDARRPSTRSMTLALLALLTLGPEAVGQQASPGVDIPVASTPAKTVRVADLSSRYRFSERYTIAEDDRAGPGQVGPYRVAVLEVVKDSVDTAKGAPRRTETSRQAIFSERPAEILAGGAVVSATRTFEKYREKPEDAARSMGTRPLEGLTLLVRPKLGDVPMILNLTEGRSLTEYEFDAISRQVFVPQFSALAPAQVVRLGDTWKIPRKAAQALLGDPSVQGETLVGRLDEIRKEVDGPRMVAAMAISGKLVIQGVETSVNAEALFTFQGEPASKASTGRPPTAAPRAIDDVIEARGAFTELRMGRVTTGPQPGPGRLRFQASRELILHRQLGVGTGGVAPPLVEKFPEMTEANSFLHHLDPSGRYSLRHPQDLLPPDRGQPSAEPNTTLLIRSRREGIDMLQVEFVPRTLAPEDLKKKLAEKYATLKMDVLKGDEAWLPEADWPGMRVHRIDAALKLGAGKQAGPAGATRIHFDGYLIQPGRSASFMAVATTSRDSVASFRQEVERILKTIQIDPGKPAVE